MANTIVTGGRQQNFVHITAMDSDYDAGYYRPLSSIQFNPGSTGTDVLVVKNGTDAGPIIFKATADAANNETCKYFDGIHTWVYIDYSLCTLSSGHNVTLVFKED